MVDEADAGLVSGLRWRLHRSRGKCYARAWIGHGPDRRSVYMHILLMGRPGIDHRNGNGLDNRRCNLRVATQGQNLANQSARVGQYKGVHLDARRGTWYAKITAGQRQRWLGSFPTPEAAARAYDKAAAETWGEFARLNFPPSVKGGDA